MDNSLLPSRGCPSHPLSKDEMRILPNSISILLGPVRRWQQRQAAGWDPAAQCSPARTSVEGPGSQPGWRLLRVWSPAYSNCPAALWHLTAHQLNLSEKATPVFIGFLPWIWVTRIFLKDGRAQRTGCGCLLRART